MVQKITTKGMLVDLCSLINHSKHLLNNGKDYQVLLEYLHVNNFYWDDDKDIPTLKELMAQTKLSSYQLQRMIKQIYKDLVLDDENELTLEFDDVEYVFNLYYLGNCVYFNTKEFHVMPRLGEKIDIPFFKNKVGLTSFYVSRINHEFLDRTHLIHIGLTEGSYNIYWHIRKDEARIKHELDYRDFIYLDDHDLKKKLGLHGW